MGRGAQRKTRREFFEDTVTRFWSYVDRKEPDECWPWTSTTGTAHEYGVFGFLSAGKSVQYRAHRLAWMLVNGTIPNGMCILHSCDNPICCNPSHLRPGTMAENMAERNDRGRHAHGEKQGHSKLTEDQARYALESEEPPSVLGKRFGVHPSAISSIRNGRNWKHLQ